MKTCEEYILKKYLDQELEKYDLEAEIEELKKKIYELENPNIESEEKKADCITLYKSANVIYELKTNTYSHYYKETFKKAFANGKVTIKELEKALEDDKTLDEINDKFPLSTWDNDKMYKFEPINYDCFEFNIDKAQYLIWGNYYNLSLSRLNDEECANGYFYEKYKENCLKKVREKVRDALKKTIEYLKEQEKSEA